MNFKNIKKKITIGNIFSAIWFAIGLFFALVFVGYFL